MTIYKRPDTSDILVVAAASDGMQKYLHVDLAYTPIFNGATNVFPSDVETAILVLEAYVLTSPTGEVPEGTISLVGWEPADVHINRHAYFRKTLQTLSPWSGWIDDTLGTGLFEYIGSIVTGTTEEQIGGLSTLVYNAYQVIIYLMNHLRLYYDADKELDPIVVSL